MVKRVYTHLMTHTADVKNHFADMDQPDDMVSTTRFVIQKILVPLVVIFGIVGNMISILVLTRRWMRCSTHYYLTALAVYDTLYLIFAKTMSLSHYSIIKEKTWYLMYQYPIGKPLVDTFSNTAVWLTITFTIERWICVRLPIRGRIWCTPRRAKSIIIVVCLAAAIITFPEFFEYTLVMEKDVNADIIVSKSEVNQGYPNGSMNGYTDQNVTSIGRNTSELPESSQLDHFTIKKAYLESFDNTLNHEQHGEKWILQTSSMASSRTYQLGYVYTCQVLFTFLPLIILLIFNR